MVYETRVFCFTTMRWHLVILFAFIVFAGLATAAPLQIDAINQAQLHRPLPATLAL
jgi:hypothetical protein